MYNEEIFEAYKYNGITYYLAFDIEEKQIVVYSHIPISRKFRCITREDVLKDEEYSNFINHKKQGFISRRTEILDDYINSETW